jgi:hypothetical protein
MTDWTPQDDWSQVKVGDTVRAMRAEQMLTGKVVDRWIKPDTGVPYALVMHLLHSGEQVEVRVRNGWQLSVPAKPAVVLPDEAGAYVDRDGEIWELRDGQWNYGNSRTWPIRTVLHYAPFTKLEPIAVTAKKVLAKVSTFAWADGFMPQLRAVAEEFGVTE